MAPFSALQVANSGYSTLILESNLQFQDFQPERTLWYYLLQELIFLILRDPRSTYPSAQLTALYVQALRELFRILLQHNYHTEE